MIISAADWSEYVNKLARVNTKAAELMQAWIDANGTDNINALFEYAYALSTKYGEAAASLACEMYDSIALAQGVSLPPALPAETAKIGEVKHLIGKALQRSPKLVSPEVGKMVKQAGADTMLHNAARDGAEWAWVPHGGETCAFCITLASKGWQTAGKSLLYNHAEHIHANCMCEFAIRHDKKSGVQGYDPQKYLDMYNGDSIDDDIIEDIHDKYGYGDAKTRQMAIRRQLQREKEDTGENVSSSGLKPEIFKNNQQYELPKEFKFAHFKSKPYKQRESFLDTIGALGTDDNITAEDRWYVANNIHQISKKENIGKIVTLSSMDEVYAIELIDYLEYNILWKIPNNDNLNDAVVRRRKRK